MRRLARSVTEHGWVAWNIEYRRVGRFGGGGGWPDDLRGRCRRGRCARGPRRPRSQPGGHMWSLGRWPPRPLARGTRSSSEATRPAARCASRCARRCRSPEWSTCGEPSSSASVAARSRTCSAGLPTRYRSGTNARPPSSGCRSACRRCSCTAWSTPCVPPSLSERYVARAVERGDEQAVFVPVPNAGHSEMVALGGAGWSAALDHIGRLRCSTG